MLHPMLIVSNISNCLTKLHRKTKINQWKIVAWAATQFIWRVIHISFLRLIFEPTDVDVFELFSPDCILLFVLTFLIVDYAAHSGYWELIQYFRWKISTVAPIRTFYFAWIRRVAFLPSIERAKKTSNGNCCRQELRLKWFIHLMNNVCLRHLGLLPIQME